MRQVVNLNLTQSHLTSYLAAAGYWDTPENRTRYKYVLSPCAYKLTASQKNQLDRLSTCTYRSVLRLSEHLSALSKERSLSHAEAGFLAMAKNGRRGLLLPPEVCGAVPPVLKVDLVQDADGKYHIAEIDSYNPRGFGYMALLDGSIPSTYVRPGPGISAIAEAMRARETVPDVEWLIIVSEMERFYAPSFGVFRAALARCGVYTRLVKEGDLGAELSAGNGQYVFIIPESLNYNAWAREKLIELYRAGELQTFYPPAAYLGSKAFLPFLSQCEGMAEFVPQCSLVSKKADPKEFVNGSAMVLKGVMSSGMKQIVFSDTDSGSFKKVLADACTMKRPSWILQKAVPQVPVPIDVFTEGGLVEREYYLRVTAYVSENGLIGAEVTGRPDPKVHGAPDCIQIPIILG